MLRNIRKRMESEKGFTLIELLVVILIIGILAAIAIPAFLGQQKKAQDSSAKSMVRNAASAAAAYATDNQGEYTGMTLDKLDDIEESLADTGSVTGALGVTVHSASSYTLSQVSKSTKRFNLTRTGGSTFRCEAAAAATACTAASTAKW